MRVALLASRADPASVNVAARLREMSPWTLGDGHVEGLPFHRSPDGSVLLFETPRMHLECDLVDRDLARAAGEPLDALLVLSRHRAASASPALTVHPVGNWGATPEFGGRPRALAPAAPRLAARVLRGLAAGAKAARLSHAVTYEATHHGPFTETPTAYVEIGTSEAAWTDPVLGRVVARAVLDACAAPDGAEPVLVAVGGSHYAPRATDLARRGAAAFGHILPGYAVDAGVDEATVAAAVARTPGATGYFVDARGSRSDLARVTRALEAAGLAPWTPNA